MKRKAKALFLAILMVFSMLVSTLSGVVVASADDELVIKLHYNRPDGKYDNWDVWFWAEGADGSAHSFASVNGEMVASYTVPAGTSKVGFIVRKGAWEAKDVGEDQFIDVAAYTSGTIHVYVESGVKTTAGDIDDSEAQKGTKLTQAKYDDGIINVKIAGTHDNIESAFVVKGPAGEVAISEVSGTNGTYSIKLAEKLDLTKTYTITYAGVEYTVTMPDFYSSTEFESQYTYTGNDLGANWTKEATTFRVWAPTADAVKVNLYKSGTKGTNDLIRSVTMKADVNGTWVATESGDLNGTYYTYTVVLGGKEVEACDPYARATGVNGDRAMVIDLDSTDPEGWENDKNPNAGITFNDAIIYELHIRDLSSDSSSGIKNVGKYLGLTEHGTTTAGGMATGIDHIKELGITHLHLLPVYDYATVDESKLDTNQFNWGYDPKNYNVPEGSYSTDPFNGEVRVNEFKQMVQSLHNDGISVVMDVVYNHVYSAGDFCFNKIVPQYFSRVIDGVYTSGSGCGNDNATERSMVSKYIVDSVLYWVEEYHIDGFRFDLVGLIDTETINKVMEEVHKVRPDVIFYGEGWSMGNNVTKDNVTLTTQTNSDKVPGFAFFSDDIRDAIKGSVFDQGTGFVSGAMGKENTLIDCFLGLDGIWCNTPSQTIKYASCHDNNTLYDRLKISRKDASEEDIIKMNNLAAAIYMLSEGIPFIHAGEEMLRSKPIGEGKYSDNSYNLTDEVNSLKWNRLDEEMVKEVFEYYKGLIEFRKAHPVLRLTTSAEVTKYVSKISGLDQNMIGFKLLGGLEGEIDGTMYVLYNANSESKSVELPEGNWDVYINSETAGTEVIETVSGTVSVEGISTLVLVNNELVEKPSDSNNNQGSDNNQNNNGEANTNNGQNVNGGTTDAQNSDLVVAVVIGVAAGVVVAGIAIGAFVLISKKR